MHSLLIICLGIVSIDMAAADYIDVRPFIDPRAKDLLITAAKSGGLENVRDQARTLCRNGGAKDCPDLWLVYAHAELGMQSQNLLSVTKEAVRHLPNSAAAHFYHVLALGQDAASGGAIRILAKKGSIRDACERVLQLDPDCHFVRSVVVNFYAAPKLLGGDPEKLKEHLAELDRRDPYSAALTHGSLAYGRKDYTAAASFFQDARRLQPDQSAPTEELLKVNIALGNFEEAFTLCLNFKPRSHSSGAKDEKFVDLSARSGLRSEEALTASSRFLSTTKNVGASERADVLINTAVILKRLGRLDEAEQQISEAEKLEKGSKKTFSKREKAYRPKAASVATQ